MTPLPGSLGSGELQAWRIDHDGFKESWNSGEGAFRVGGRWNSAGTRAVYCSVDPATTILEVAAHKGFTVLDTVPHVITQLEVTDHSTVHVVKPSHIPNPNWLIPGIPSTGQQAFGDRLLATHDFVLIPSVVSRNSWNLIFDAMGAKDKYKKVTQKRFTLDTRLNASART